MSHPTPRKSALTKRKTDGDSLTGLPKKNKLKFANENEINPTPSPPSRLTPSPPPSRTLKRSKSFSVLTGKEDDNISDKVNCDPTVFIPKYKQDPSSAIQDDQQPSETVETVHQPDNTPEANHQRDETVKTDQQAMPKLKIKVMDATNTIPDSIVEVDYHETVAGLKKVIILRFLEEELDPCRIRLIFNSDSVAASTSRELPDHWWIREETKLGSLFGDETSFEDDVKVKVEVQILPRLKTKLKSRSSHVSRRSSPVSF